MSEIRKLGSLMAAAFMLFGITYLLIRAIPAFDMHADEELSYNTTTGRTLSYVVQYEATSDVHPPLWYATFWGWQQLAGSSEYAGRLHAILFSMVTLSLAYRIGCDWFGNSGSGLFVMAALGVNAYFFVYSLDIRPYGMTMCAVTLSMWTFQHWLKRANKRSAIAYGITVALMLYIHYYTVFVVLVQGLVFFLSKPSWRRVGQYSIAGTAAFSLWSVWIPVVIHQLLTIRYLTRVSNDGSFNLGAPMEITSIGVPRLLQIATNGMVWLTVLVLVVGLFSLWRKREYWIALMWAILIPTLLFLINLVAAIYTSRYISYVSVGLAVAVGAALAHLPTRLRYFSILGFVGLNLWMLPGQWPIRPPFRVMLQELSRAAKPGDVMFLNRGSGPLGWQVEHYLSPELRQNTFDDLSEVQDSRRIWYSTSDWQNSGVRAIFDQIEQTHPLQKVIGDCNVHWCYLIQLLEAPPLTEPLDFGDNMLFWGIDVDSVTRDAIQARLWWRAESTPRGDYSIGLYLLDSSGALAAQSDGPINNFGTTLTSTIHLEPNAIYIDYRVITTSSLPRGQYQLALAVYRWTDKVRLKLPDGTDLLRLDTIMLP